MRCHRRCHRRCRCHRRLHAGSSVRTEMAAQAPDQALQQCPHTFHARQQAAEQSRGSCSSDVLVVAGTSNSQGITLQPHHWHWRWRCQTRRCHQHCRTRTRLMSSRNQQQTQAQLRNGWPAAVSAVCGEVSCGGGSVARLPARMGCGGGGSVRRLPALTCVDAQLHQLAGS